MRHSALVLAAVLALTTAGCGMFGGGAQKAPKADPAPPPFINRVWQVVDAADIARGTYYVFVSDNTLLVTAPGAPKPVLGRWHFAGGGLVLIERDNQVGKDAKIKKLTFVSLDGVKPAPLGDTLPVVAEERVVGGDVVLVATPEEALTTFTVAPGFRIELVAAEPHHDPLVGRRVVEPDDLSDLTGDTWSPSEVQETVWSWAKTLYEKQASAGEPRGARELVLDRAITYDLDLYDALKIGLVSVDSTMRAMVDEIIRKLVPNEAVK